MKLSLQFIAILLITLVVILIPISANSGVLYLKNGKAVSNVQDIEIKGEYIYFTVDGKALKIRAKDVKEIGWVTNEARNDSDSQQHQTQKTTKKVEKSYSQPNPIARVPRDKAKVDIKEELSRRYAGHYSTQKMLLDSNMRSYDYLISLPPNSVNNEILSNLISRYYPNFSTIKMLYESNIKSYQELQE